MNQKNLALYIHIPFCIRKCLYCDFLSGPFTEGDRTIYISALIEEIKEKSISYNQRTVMSIFFGGGTPSILSGEEMISIMSVIKTNYHLSDSCEITMEMNPGTVDKSKIEGYVRAGINRVSIGLQSANDDELRRLGRIHNYEEFLEAYQLVNEAGIHNVNVDLMSGIPGQTIASFKDTLHKVLSLKPALNHISAYSLIIEEGTPFYDMELDIPDEETDREMYKITNDILGQNGLRRYEISNYSREGYECRHNIVYWKRGDYLGLGLGASSMIDNTRWKNTSDILEYCSKSFGKFEEEFLSAQNQMEEFMFLGLRLTKGISVNDFIEYFNTGLPKEYEKVIDKYISLGYLVKDGENIRFTESGIDISNVILSEFLFGQL